MELKIFKAVVHTDAYVCSSAQASLCECFFRLHVYANTCRYTATDTYTHVHTSGNIRVGGIDTKSIGLHRLRRSMAIIPQEPQLFAGPLRSVLDPFDEYTDESLWAGLKQVCITLWHFVLDSQNNKQARVHNTVYMLLDLRNKYDTIAWTKKNDNS